MVDADDGFHHLGSKVAVPASDSMAGDIAGAAVTVMLKSWTCPAGAAPEPARIELQLGTAKQDTGTCVDLSPSEAREVAHALLELADTPELGEEAEGEATTPPRQSSGRSPEEALRAAISSLSTGGLTFDLGDAMVFRRSPSRSLLIVGRQPELAAELRTLITAGKAPGWNLYPLPAVRTPLRALQEPLLRASGSVRCYNLLSRSGFEHVEEVAAVPDGCFREVRNAGTTFVSSVREAISSLEIADAPAAETVTIDLHAPEGQQPAVLEPVVLEAFRVLAAWAVSETAACTVEDLARHAAEAPGLPTDVAVAWDRIRTLSLHPIASPLLPAVELATLADELLAELGDRRRLILASRTFAPKRRTYASLARELGVTHERVRQMEKDALARLGRAAADDRYAPLRWRAASVSSQPARMRYDCPDEPRPWTGMLLSWLGEALRPVRDPDGP